jgi:hypothetical protein
MAITDARTVPIRGQAFRFHFGIQNAANNGSLISNATSVAAQIIKDGTGPSATTNSPTQIGTSGVYYLDLTAGETSYTSIVIIVTSSSAGAATQVFEFNPQTVGSIPVDVNSVSGSATAATNLGASAAAVVTGTVVTAQLATPTTTYFETSLTNATANFYVNRTLVFTSGANAGQAVPVIGYSYIGANGYITVPPLAAAPSSGDSFVIV